MDRMKICIRYTTICCVISTALLIILPTKSRAFSNFPDYESTGFSFDVEPKGSYDASTGIFQIENEIQYAFEQGYLDTSFSGIFSISARIDSSGNFIQGTASLIGSSDYYGIPDNTQLVSGAVIDFVYGAPFINPFEFLIDVSIIDERINFGTSFVASLWAPPSNFMTSPEEMFSESFQLLTPFTHSGIIAAAPVPEPTTLALLSAGLVVFAGFTKRSKKR